MKVQDGGVWNGARWWYEMVQDGGTKWCKMMVWNWKWQKILS